MNALIVKLDFCLPPRRRHPSRNPLFLRGIPGHRHPSPRPGTLARRCGAAVRRRGLACGAWSLWVQCLGKNGETVGNPGRVGVDGNGKAIHQISGFIGFNPGKKGERMEKDDRPSHFGVAYVQAKPNGIYLELVGKTCRQAMNFGERTQSD